MWDKWSRWDGPFVPYGPHHLYICESAICCRRYVPSWSLNLPEFQKKAIQWYTQAAEKGLPEVQFKFAEINYKGEGVPQNFEKALNLYKKAAEQGIADTMFCLGKMYFDGKGASTNFEKAILWYKKASDMAIAICFFFNLGKQHLKRIT